MNGLTCRTRLPTEILRIIILGYISTARDDYGTIEVPRKSYKAPWGMVEPLTLASRTCRRLALEGWFDVYFAHSPNELSEVWPESSIWTKYVSPAYSFMSLSSYTVCGAGSYTVSS